MSDITRKIDAAASENARLRGRLEENNELLDSKLGQFQLHLETKDEEMTRLRQEVGQKEQLQGLGLGLGLRVRVRVRVRARIRVRVRARVRVRVRVRAWVRARA